MNVENHTENNNEQRAEVTEIRSPPLIYAAPKRARPRKPVLPEVVRELAAGMHTQTEIASRLGISIDTLQRRMQEPEFQQAFAAGREEGLANLRMWQMQAAKKHDRIMLIWLGKQYLGQRDNVEVSGPGGAKLSIEVEFKPPPGYEPAIEATLAEALSETLLEESFKLLSPRDGDGGETD